jgi:hypothetical protein
VCLSITLGLMLLVFASCTSSPSRVPPQAPPLVRAQEPITTPEELAGFCATMAQIAAAVVESRNAGVTLETTLADFDAVARRASQDIRTQMIAALAQQYARMVHAHPQWTRTEAYVQAYQTCMEAGMKHIRVP